MPLRAQYLYDFAAASSCSPRLFVASFARLSYYQCWFKRSVLCEWRHKVPCQGTMALSTLAAPAKKRRLSAKLSPFYLLLLGDAGRQGGGANEASVTNTSWRIVDRRAMCVDQVFRTSRGATSLADPRPSGCNTLRSTVNQTPGGC